MRCACVSYINHIGSDSLCILALGLKVKIGALSADACFGHFQVDRINETAYSPIGVETASECVIFSVSTLLVADLVGEMV